MYRILFAVSTIDKGQRYKQKFADDIIVHDINTNHFLSGFSLFGNNNFIAETDICVLTIQNSANA